MSPSPAQEASQRRRRRSSGAGRELEEAERGVSSIETSATPVRFPPGRLRLATRLCWTGWLTSPKTIGVVAVASFAASCRVCDGKDHVDLGSDQFRGKSRQQIDPSIRVPPFVKNVLALYPAKLPHGNVEEVARHFFGRGSLAWAQDTDARHLARLLRADSERGAERTGQRGQQEAAAVHAGKVGRMGGKVNLRSETSVGFKRFRLD